MKSPDEIKKGLEYLSIKDIVKKLDMWKEGIAYDYAEDAAADALALIQQLQAENAEQAVRIQQLEAERDAAVADILYAASVYLGECETCKNGEVCAACKRKEACDECPNSKCMCSGCGAGHSNWQWRGVQKEE